MANLPTKQGLHNEIRLLESRVDVKFAGVDAKFAEVDAKFKVMQAYL
ncbi:MAG: hypothetical protein M1346_01265 [Gammaproteobacteria bacterium]|nr:hypothetical protein [Gammaproteobacteria bacterium]